MNSCGAISQNIGHSIEKVNHDYAFEQGLYTLFTSLVHGGQWGREEDALFP